MNISSKHLETTESLCHPSSSVDLQEVARTLHCFLMLGVPILMSSIHIFFLASNKHSYF